MSAPGDRRPPDDLDRGTRWSGLLTPLGDEAPPVPCHVITGQVEGPTVLVTAGIHGAEYASIAAAQRLAKVDAHALLGRLIVVPIVNTAAYFARTIYVNPLDGKNLNRVFPGRPDGTESERLAHWLVSELLRYADAYVDLHGGDLIEALTPFTLHWRGDAKSAAMAEAFGLPIRIEQEGRGMTFSAAHDLGVPAVLAEAGGQGLWPDSTVGLLEDGVRRVLAHLQMTEAATPAAGAPSQVIDAFVWSRSEHDGCWHPAVTVGEHVQTGQVLGTVTDLLDNVVQEARSQVDGTVLFTVTSLAINRDDPLVGVGRPRTTPSGDATPGDSARGRAQGG